MAAEFHVTIQVRNNRLLSRRKKLGVNQKTMAQAIGITLDRYRGLEICKYNPVEKGVWTKQALAVADYWDEDTEELFPEGILLLRTNKVEREADFQTLLMISEGRSSVMELPASDLSERIDKVLETLQPRVREVIERRHGLGEFDLEGGADICKDWRSPGTI